ncbi:hypothetical protein SAMN04487983_10316 [Streptomyces sp. yr375]|uniref:hypothetical protein n=1 Tax=Streptomyces sp. yr375 TaxID=1761906 RepID=UPI0008C84C51|nr:hypothetical protein [Streptomyces sp. yr375]SES09478.1 hypothetical protein SAMN04487983_10316 [Streptomyces sp. yr375]
MTITAGASHRPQPEAGARSSQPAITPPVGSPGPQRQEASRTGGPGHRPAQRTVAAWAALRRRYWATVPARLRLLRAATVVLAAALALLLTLAGLAALGTWNSVADRDAPRTTSAADLDLALNDMDAQAANILLSNGDAGKGRLQTPYQKAVGFYGGARKEIGHDLRTLAVAAQGDKTDEKSVESLTDDFAEYQELIGRALENDGHHGGKASALVDYRRATDLLQQQLVPAARTLVSSNDKAFDAEYSSARSALSSQPSNAHFGAWMAALDKVTDINRAHFTASTDAGRSAVTGQLPWAGGLLLAAMALTALGLRPRLAEFR